MSSIYANLDPQDETLTPLCVFRRVITIPETDLLNEQIINAGVLNVMHELFDPQRYVFTTLRNLLRRSSQECIFSLAGNAKGLNAGVPTNRFRAVYEAPGLMVSDEGKRNAISRLRKDFDIDFHGTVSRQRGEFFFEGEQSDAFEELSAMAIAVDTQNYPELPTTSMPYFETIRRREMTTLIRYPIQPTTLSQSAACIGEGVLGWTTDERRLDRYGYVQLWSDYCEGTDHVAINAKRFVGTRASLIAQIIEPRSLDGLWGDEQRRFFPQPVSAGETILLGSGWVSMLGPNSIGCVPDDGRDIDWLSPRALYMCRGHRVRLYVEPQV